MKNILIEEQLCNIERRWSPNNFNGYDYCKVEMSDSIGYDGQRQITEIHQT